MSRERRSLFGTLKQPGILNLRMSPLWLSPPVLFLSALRNTWLRQPQTYLGDHTLLMQTIFGHTMYLDSRDISLTPHLLRQVAGSPMLLDSSCASSSQACASSRSARTLATTRSWPVCW